MVAALALATVLAAASSDAHIPFAASVEEAKAHLLVARELYAAGDAREAALHASHPVQEIGGRITGPITRGDAGLGGRVRDALKTPRRDVDARIARAAFERNLDATVALLDEAVARVVPPDVRGTLAYRTAVLRTLLVGLVKEYEEGEKNGRITQVVEYHDAYGFFRRSQALYRELAPALREASAQKATVADERFASVARALPGLTPPAAPMSAAALKDAIMALVQALTPSPGS